MCFLNVGTGIVEGIWQFIDYPNNLGVYPSAFMFQTVDSGYSFEFMVTPAS